MVAIRLVILLLIYVFSGPIFVACQPQRVAFKSVNLDKGLSYSIEKDRATVDPKILIAVTVKDHGYSLPTFLATLETLECPNVANKCDLW